MSAHKPAGGRPAFEPTELQRRQVTTLVAEGNAPEVIAVVLEISEPTLRKYFHVEIQRGRALGQAKNTRRLHAAAEGGNVTAMIWLDKTRFGVREPDAVGKKALVQEQAAVADEGTRWQGLLQ